MISIHLIPLQYSGCSTISMLIISCGLVLPHCSELIVFVTVSIAESLTCSVEFVSGIFSSTHLDRQQVPWVGGCEGIAVWWDSGDNYVHQLCACWLLSSRLGICAGELSKILVCCD